MGWCQWRALGFRFFCRPVVCLIFVRFSGGGCSAVGLPFEAVSGIVYVMLGPF